MIVAGLDPHSLEPRIREIGAELHRRVGRGWRGPRTRLDEALMGLGSDPELRAALLRFVDVYPACRGPADVGRHFVEHIGEVERVPLGLRPVVGWGRAMRGHGLARPVAIGVGRMARRFIIGSSPNEALPYLEGRWRAGVAASVDLLGELTVGEREASAYAMRCAGAIETIGKASAAWPERGLLERDSISALPRANLSVKVTALTPRVHPEAPWVGAADARERLRMLLRRTRDVGGHLHVDMEQLDSRETTLEVALGLLEEPEFREGPSAGLVVQAYLRDSVAELDRLLSWSNDNPRSQPLTIRLVKGAYWDHEVAIARQQGWEPPVFTDKEACDANFERLTRRLLEARPLVRVAVASHNLRSLVHAVAANRALGGADQDIELQVLHGLGDRIADALAAMDLRVRAYCPVGDLVAGMGYLVRRLLENTSNESFLHHQAAGEPLDELLRPPSAELLAA